MRVQVGLRLGSWDHRALQGGLGPRGPSEPSQAALGSGAGVEAPRLLLGPTCAEREMRARLGLCSLLTHRGSKAAAQHVGYRQALFQAQGDSRDGTRPLLSGRASIPMGVPGHDTPAHTRAGW